MLYACRPRVSKNLMESIKDLNTIRGNSIISKKDLIFNEPLI